MSRKRRGKSRKAGDVFKTPDESRSSKLKSFYSSDAYKQSRDEARRIKKEKQNYSTSTPKTKTNPYANETPEQKQARIDRAKEQMKNSGGHIFRTDQDRFRERNPDYGKGPKRDWVKEAENERNQKYQSVPISNELRNQLGGPKQRRSRAENPKYKNKWSNQSNFMSNFEKNFGPNKSKGRFDLRNQ